MLSDKIKWSSVSIIMALESPVLNSGWFKVNLLLTEIHYELFVRVYAGGIQLSVKPKNLPLI